MLFNLFAVYKSPQSNLNNFLTYLENITDTYKNSIFFGDFNFNLLEFQNNKIEDYVDIFACNGYVFLNKIHIKHCIRVKNNSGSILDHVITDILAHKYTITLHDTPLSEENNTTKLQFF